MHLTINGYSDRLSEYKTLCGKMRLSTSMRRRRHTLKNQLTLVGLIEEWDSRDIDLLEEAAMGVELICKQLRFRRSVIQNDDELNRSIKAYLNRCRLATTMAGITNIQSQNMLLNTIAFDFVAPSRHAAVVELTEDETLGLERKTGLQRTHLWAVAGLDFTDIELLSRTAVVDRAVPLIVNKYCSLRRNGILVDPEVYFNLSAWKIGLH